MEQRFTSKKTYINARYSDMGLWMHINPRVRKRVDEFWKYFIERLSLYEDKLIDVESFDALKFDFASLITKQVYSMALIDNLYQENKNKAKFDWAKEDEKLDNLIEICFSYPTLLTSMLFTDKREVMDLLKEQIRDLKQITSPEGEKVLKFFAKAKTTENKEELEKILKSAKENLMANNIKPTQKNVSDLLDMKNTTLRDKLNRLKINFYKI